MYLEPCYRVGPDSLTGCHKALDIDLPDPLGCRKPKTDGRDAECFQIDRRESERDGSKKLRLLGVTSHNQRGQPW